MADAALAGSHAGHHFRAVGGAGLGVERTLAAGEALHDEARVIVNQNTHR